MARTVDETAHRARRDGFLDAMERLLVGKGFDAITIADVLAEAQTSKGAFYHYFDSKTALMEGVQRRLLDRMAAAVEPVVAEAGTAMAKLAAVTAVMVRWKEDRLPLLLESARAWFGPDNAQPRERVRELGRDWLATQLELIIRQGNAEGVFAAPRPALDARLAVILLQDLQERMAKVFIAPGHDAEALADVEDWIDGYHAALERLLGAEPGSIHIVPKAALPRWLPN